MFSFRWIEWNIDKCTAHKVTPEEAEYVVNHARHPYPRRIEDEKILVWGQAQTGRYLQVIYLVQEDDDLFVIHARPLTAKEKHRHRRRKR